MTKFTGIQYTSLASMSGKGVVFRGRHTCLKEGVRLWQITCPDLHPSRELAVKDARIQAMKHLIDMFLEVQK